MDGSLEDEELVTIFDLNENTFKKLSPSYKNLLHQHAKKSGEHFDLVFPNDTLTKALIQNHHGPQFDNDFHEKLEKMEEKGGYLYLFSLAQNLSQEILKKAFDGPELKKAIEIIKELYPKADILDSLKKLA